MTTTNDFAAFFSAPCTDDMSDAAKAARLAQMRATHGYEPSTDADVQYDLDAESAI